MGFTELVVVGIVALIFIGPKQLPEVARVVARLLNEFRRATGDISKQVYDIRSSATQFVNDTKQDIRSEIEKAAGVDEIKNQFNETKNSVVDDLKKGLDELPDDWGIQEEEDDGLDPHDEFGNVIVDDGVAEPQTQVVSNQSTDTATPEKTGKEDN